MSNFLSASLKFLYLFPKIAQVKPILYHVVQVVLSAFVAASQAAPQLVYPYGLGYSHAITHAVPTTVKKVNTTSI